MPLDIKLPNIEGVESGDVIELLVKEGESVTKDQGLLELETGKATLTIPSTHAGKIAKIHVKAGQTVPIGAVLVTLDGATESAPAKPAAKSAAAAPAKPAAEKPAPAKPAAAAPVAPKPQPAKPAPSPERPAPVQPVAAKPAPVAPVQPAPQTSAASGDGGSAAAGPAVRRFAREVGVDLGMVSGSGEGGRITRDDVLAVVRQASQTSQQQTTTKSAAGPKNIVTPPGEPATDPWGPVRVERMSRMRKTIAAQMHLSWTTVPRVTNFDDADITDLEKFRQESKGDYSAVGIKLTTLPFIIKAAALSLRTNPAVNASIDGENEQIIYKEYVNVGVAVDTDRGLVVPSIRSCDQLPIPEIARELAATAEKVRTGQFTLDDLKGSTFTISNLGAIGGTYSTPIVNVPEVAILLVGRAREMPVVRDGKIAVRLMLPLSLSYDHRLVDGATAARFLNDIIKYLEAPSRMLLAI